MAKIEVALYKTNRYISTIEKGDTEHRSIALQKQLDYFKEIKEILEEKEKKDKEIDLSFPEINDIATAIVKLKCSFYSFFPNSSEDFVKQIIQVWYDYLKKYKKVVVQDAIDRLITTPSEYGKAPNLPDVVFMCETLKYDDKYKSEK